MTRAGSRGSATVQWLVRLILYGLVWQLLPVLGIVKGAFLPTPLAVGHALLDLLHDASFYGDLGATLLRTLAGLFFGLLVGVPIGAAMALMPPVEEFFGPIVKSTYSLPKTALVPLLILWFGIGSTANIVAIVSATILPLIVYTYHGVQGAPRILLWSARAMGTPPRALFWHVYLRAAVPDILTGLRIGLGFALVIA